MPPPLSPNLFCLPPPCPPLQRASAASPESSIVPNTIDMALQPSREARAIIRADPPFVLMHVNGPWGELGGVTQADAEGSALCDALRLHPSQEDQLYALAADCSVGRASSAILMTRSLADSSQPALVYFKVTHPPTPPHPSPPHPTPPHPAVTKQQTIDSISRQ